LTENKNVWPHLFKFRSGCPETSNILSTITTSIYTEDNRDGRKVCEDHLVTGASPLIVYLKPGSNYTSLVASTSEKRLGKLAFEQIPADNLIGCVPKSIGPIEERDNLKLKKQSRFLVLWIVLGIFLAGILLGILYCILQALTIV